MPKKIPAKQALAGISRDAQKYPYSEPPNSFAHTQSKVSSSKEITIPHLANARAEDLPVRLALISLQRPKKSKLVGQLATKLPKSDGSFGAVLRKLISYPRGDAGKLLTAFKQSISSALDKYGANIVCVNELGLPMDVSKRRPRAWNNAIDFCRNMARTHNCLILAGTAHDHVTCLNTAYLFYPKCERQGIAYHKQVSAWRVREGQGEHISIPPRRMSINTTVFGLRVGFLTCLDIADYSAVAPLVKLERRLDLLLIPTYTTEYEPLKRVGRLVSNAISGYVGLTNYCRRGEQSAHLLKFGEEEPLESSYEKKSTSPMYHLSIYEIDPSELALQKADHAEQLDERIRWLFGLTGPQVVSLR